jgi:hypothetical protein
MGVAGSALQRSRSAGRQRQEDNRKQRPMSHQCRLGYKFRVIPRQGIHLAPLRLKLEETNLGCEAHISLTTLA